MEQSLQLSAPIPLTLHPASVYLSGLQDNSYRTIRYCLNTIARTLTQNECDYMTIDWSKIRYHHIMAIRAILIEKYQPTTANLMITALKKVIKETYKLGLIDINTYEKTTDIQRITGSPEPKGKALTESEIHALINTCNSNHPRDIRDKAILGILRGGGLRRTEVINIKLEDVNLKEETIYVKQSKRKKSRIVYIPKFTIEFIEEWLKIRGYSDNYLFCSINKGKNLQMGKMHSDSIRKIVQKRCQQANINPYNPHDFRCTFCGDLLSAGVDIVTVQKLAGHSSPSTTATYDRRDGEIKRKAVQNLGF